MTNKEVLGKLYMYPDSQAYLYRKAFVAGFMNGRNAPEYPDPNLYDRYFMLYCYDQDLEDTIDNTLIRYTELHSYPEREFSSQINLEYDN